MTYKKSSNCGEDQFRIKVRSAGNNSYSGAAAAHHLSVVDSQYQFEEQQVVACQSYDDSLHASMRRKRSGVALLHNLEQDELDYGLITAQIY